ncbi:hypothetical protein SeLEV6574_g03673 [Synchytrium endobioticum]|uniref:CCAAT-binding factor domain-containing protein n=1 Tax=Synchytrium endobioticum TaxID=286115 RepID=A0A507D2S8_9FUNG|nr:hypothetical protein SeLEV6574_g03673 [Synchytrium endobioticum]
MTTAADKKRKNASINGAAPSKKHRPYTPKPESKVTPKPKTSEMEMLQKYVMELGGDDGDLDLIADVLNESDLEDGEHGEKGKASPTSHLDNGMSPDASLQNDIQAFIVKEFGSFKQTPNEDDTGKEMLVKKATQVLSTGNPTVSTGRDSKTFNKIEKAKRESAATGNETDTKSKPKFAANKKERMLAVAAPPVVPNLKKTKLLVDPTTVWYALPYFDLPLPTVPVPDQLFNDLYRKAASLMEAESLRFAKQVRTRSAGDKNFLSTVLKSGTVTDKVSALTILVQEAPLYSLKHLKEDLLEGMAKKKSKREAILAIDSIRDLMMSLLLPDRKLRYFRDQPLEDPKVTDAHLLVWYFEDTLKKIYFELIKTLEVLIHDPVLNVKTRALTYISDLLAAKPEQEQNLLLLLVNKLGDADRKVAAKAVHHLTQLLSAHPNMKMIVIKEAQQLLFRPKASPRAQYISLTFLNQIVLSHRPEDVKAANHLVEIYFTMFEKLAAQMRNRGRVSNVDDERPNGQKKDKERWRDQKGKKKKVPQRQEPKHLEEPKLLADGIESKMMSALLTGVNRAFPFSKLDDAIFDKYLDSLFQFSHIGNFATAVQALSLIFQVQSTRDIVTDRYYRVLYGTLFDRRLYTASRQAVYLNLLYRSLKADPSLNRTRAVLKRLVQVCTHAQIPFVCASLFLIGEIIKVKPGLKSMTSDSEVSDFEVFTDKPSDNAENSNDDDSVKEKVSEGYGVAGGKGDKKSEAYDGLKRDPLYANAQLTSFWELTPFRIHFHPTVSLYATTLLLGQSIELPSSSINYDPLQNHTLSRFLDRFVYKNPRVVKTLHKGSSLMQPRLRSHNDPGKDFDRIVAGGRKRVAVLMEDEDKADGTVNKKKKFLDNVPVNDESWLRVPEGQLPVDEVFFHRFFKARSSKHPSSSSQANKKKVDERDTGDDEDMSDSQDLDEDEVWNAMLKSSGLPLPEAGDEEEDEGLDDFDALGNEDDDDDNEDDDNDSGSGTPRVDNGVSELDNAEVVDEDIEEGVLRIQEDQDASDSEFARLWDDDNVMQVDEDEDFGDNDDESSMEEEENPSSRSRRAMMKKKALALGYKGDFFDCKIRKKDDKKKSSKGSSKSSNLFASLEDFEALVERDDDEDM